MTCLSETTHTAAKPRRCHGCQTMIEVGQRYTRYAGVWDGEFYTIHHHVECAEAEQKLNKANGLCGEEWMALHEHLEEAGVELLTELDPVVSERLRKWAMGSNILEAAE